jgi:DNA-binding MarR family transcriptional regulator
MKHTIDAAFVTDLILEVFRLNGQLLEAGDRLTKPLDLTSARWQVLGAIDIAGRSLSVPQIGRRMGISRQAVQRIANDLEGLGFVTFESNPDHARARLVVLTDKARSVLAQIRAWQIERSNNLSRGMDAGWLSEAVEVLREMKLRREQMEFATKESTTA